MQLRGYDLSGQTMTATITSLPAAGTLYQLSRSYDRHGYQPKEGEAIVKVPTNITGGHGTRLLYKRPSSSLSASSGTYVTYTYTAASITGGRQQHSSSLLPYGKWASFTYHVTGAKTRRTSTDGQVLLLPPSNVMVGSSFIIDTEGWTVVGNHPTRSTAVVYDHTSRGLQSRFIYASDELIKVGSNYRASLSSSSSSSPAPSASRKKNRPIDLSLWYFRAPPAFSGNQGLAYGGQLSFTLSSFAGDFSEENIHWDAYVVFLDCEKCRAKDNSGKSGVRLGMPLRSALPNGLLLGRDVPVALNLTEKAGWLEDTRTPLQAWQPPTRCTFIQVLSSLSGLSILGDYTKYYETISIDSVALTSNPKSKLPMCAQGSPDARACTCPG